MAYVEQTLLPGEKILYATKPHYIVFTPLFLWVALGVGFEFYGAPLLSALFLVGALGNFISELISYLFSEYVVTTRRVIMKVGLVRRRSFEIFLERIEGIYISQSITGRILGFGTVVVAGIGGSKNSFYYIPRPLEFRRQVQHQLPKVA